MSVESVMASVEASEAAVDAGTAAPAQTGKSTVSNIDDVFNLYDGDEEESEAAKNGIELKDDKSVPEVKEPVTAKEKKPEEETKPEEEQTEELQGEAKTTATPDMVKVKVNGIEREVPLQEVLNSYSGQQEIQRRFTEFDKSKKAFEAEKNELVGMNTYVKQEIGDLKTSFEGVVNTFQKNGFLDKDPMQAVYQLLDKMGINSNMYERAVFEHNLPEYAKFFNMTDVEREAYVTKKENDYLRRREQGLSERDQQVKLREEKQRQSLDLIKSAGLDSVKYEELSNELLDAGHKDVTPEKVVEYAKQKPTLDRLVNIFNQAQMDPAADQRSRTIFNLLKEFPDTTDEEILDHLIPDRAALKTAKVLSSKTQKAPAPKKAAEDADFDEMMSFFKN